MTTALLILHAIAVAILHAIAVAILHAIAVAILHAIAVAGVDAEQFCTKTRIPPGVALPRTRVPDRTPENVTLPFPVYCQPGYVPKDVQLQMTCRRTEQGSLEWTNPCRPIMCLLLINPAGGTVSMNGRRVGSVANYTCKMGMVYIGTNPRVCREDGNFSGTDGYCRHLTKGCVDPDLPENVIVMSNDGETLTLSCDSDELVYTGQNLVCVARVWSAAVGSCVVKEDIFCSPPNIPNTIFPSNNKIGYDQVYHPDVSKDVIMSVVPC